LHVPQLLKVRHGDRASEMVLSSGCCVSPCALVPQWITVAEIGMSSVTKCVTEQRSPKWTRTVTPPPPDLARGPLATPSARRRGVRVSRPALQQASCRALPVLWRPRRCVLIWGGSRLQASAVGFSEVAGPSNRVGDHSDVFASCPMVSTPISVSRALLPTQRAAADLLQRHGPITPGARPRPFGEAIACKFGGLRSKSPSVGGHAVALLRHPHHELLY
jgi:hypothetical protein